MERCLYCNEELKIIELLSSGEEEFLLEDKSEHKKILFSISLAGKKVKSSIDGYHGRVNISKMCSKCMKAIVIYDLE